MLILTRIPGETLKIGDDITVTILEVRNGRQARIGIEAPRTVHVLRGELMPRPVVLKPLPAKKSAMLLEVEKAR